VHLVKKRRQLLDLVDHNDGPMFRGRRAVGPQAISQLFRVGRYRPELGSGQEVDVQAVGKSGPRQSGLAGQARSEEKDGLAREQRLEVEQTPEHEGRLPPDFMNYSGDVPIRNLWLAARKTSGASVMEASDLAISPQRP